MKNPQKNTEEALKLMPHERNAHLNLGMVYEFMGNDRRAVVHYKKELFRYPNSAETLYNIGRLYFENHRWLQASRYFERCFDLGVMHQMEDTVDKIGLCYYRLKNVQS
jgi:Tfp pilus assembly protein PilF